MTRGRPGAPATTAATGNPGGRRPNNDHRQVVAAMLWRARTGAPWRDLPSEDGSCKMVASLDRWRRDGI